MNSEPKTPKILLVEDSPTDAELCIRALQKHQLANALLWVKDGAEALEFLLGADTGGGPRADQELKVILLDLKLPKVDGLEVLRRLKADSHARKFPVVVLTSSKEDQDITAAYDLGASSYIDKPVASNEFVDTIAKVGLYWLQVNRPVSGI
jgi:CheY-like chemotaxis protein